MLSVIALVLAQVGPGGALPQAPLEMRRKAPPAVQSAVTTDPLEERFRQCLEAAASDGESGILAAQAWRDRSSGVEAARASQCLGNAYNYQARWAEAEDAFLAARDAEPADQPGRRAVLGAMAGQAALDHQQPEGAEAHYRRAHEDALRSGRLSLAGSIAADWSRALVALGRLDDAEKALTEARVASPDNPLGWLLSATLARRQDRLAEAQQWIERAAELMPVDPDIGLEAGVIAVLSGRDAAARKSWESVLQVAPGSDTARQAQSYLDQLAAKDAPEGR